MPKHAKTPMINGLELELPDTKEEARINAGIAADLVLLKFVMHNLKKCPSGQRAVIKR